MARYNAPGGVHMQIYDGRDDKKAFSTTHTAAVISSNRVVCAELDQMTLRKNGRQDWSLFYCEAGRLYFDDRVLETGQVWLYAPGVPQKYTMYSQDKTVYRYLHFNGSDVAGLLSSLGIVCSVPIQVKSGVLTGLFDQIQNCIADDSPLSGLQAEYHTLQLICQIAENRLQSSETHLLKQVTDRMEHSFATPYDAQLYAQMLNLSVSRFQHLFRQHLGQPPYAYYVQLRIANACSLLEETDLRIGEIAETCGYEDAMYFTQAFKRITGLTPSDYRKAKQLRP